MEYTLLEPKNPEVVDFVAFGDFFSDDSFVQTIVDNSRQNRLRVYD